MANFIDDFFPTPKHLISKLLNNVKFAEIVDILEPSAGKGDICDYIIPDKDDRYHSRKNVCIDTIEINPDLQMILEGKKHRLIHDDFLTFNTIKRYDLIVANFPFSDGDKHLQKALSMIQENGGMLRCFVNAETLKNPYTKTRQWCVNTIKNLCGDIEYLSGEFTNAERKTNVEIALVSVSIEVEKTDSVIFDSMEAAPEFVSDNFGPKDLVSNDYVQSLIASYNQECKIGAKLIEEYFALQSYINDEISLPGESSKPKPLIKLEIEGAKSYSNSIGDKINNYLRGVRLKYWRFTLNDLRKCGKFTSNILDALYKKQNDLADYDYTLFNIQKLEKDLAGQMAQGIHDAILTLFDQFCRYAYRANAEGIREPDCANVHYYNGWKTNKAHKINPKIILPVNGISSYSYGKGRLELDKYKIQEKFVDMIKVFQMLQMNDNADAFQLVSNQVECADNRRDYELDMRYFEVKFYKKGTCHIKFTNKKLLDKLNIYGSQKKGWLPPSYGKKSYTDMNSEEKTIVDDFQGKAEYEKVFAERDFYLVGANPLQLTA